MIRATSIVLAVFAASCGSSRAIPTEHARLSTLALEIPAGWRRIDLDQRGIASAQWAPEINSRKEALTVTRTQRSPLVARGGVATIQPLLVEAQRSLAKLKMSPTTVVSTPSGLVGARVDVDFVPAGLRETYHRTHVVLVDGDALVHVIYTAKSPDPELTALSRVLDTLRHEEG